MFNSGQKICFEQQDVITTSVVWILLLGTSLTTILILSVSFPFKVNPKKLLGHRTRLSKNGKEGSYCVFV